MTAAVSIIAAFEPFAGRRRNRSLEVLQGLPAAAARQTRVLPVDFVRLRPAIDELIALRPRSLLLLGEASRMTLSVEQMALNVLDAEKPDNAGRLAHGVTLVRGGALALRADWEAHAVAERLREARVASEASFHAGTYACNAAYYLALHALGGSGSRVGFLHVPRRGWPMGPRLGSLVKAALIAEEALLSR